MDVANPCLPVSVTGSIEAAAPEEVCLLGVSWQGSQGAVGQWGEAQ